MLTFAGTGGESLPGCIHLSYSLRSAELLVVFQHTDVCF